MKYYLGLAIGRTRSKAGLMDEQGRMIVQFIFPARADEPAENMFNDLIDLISQRQRTRPSSTLEGIGVGLPRVLDREKSDSMLMLTLGSGIKGTIIHRGEVEEWIWL
jgi:predicted NBD/HSP70 family sugar kinase